MAERDQIEYVIQWMLDESDDIEGTPLALGDDRPVVWLHSTERVRSWLRERLPSALSASVAALLW